MEDLPTPASPMSRILKMWSIPEPAGYAAIESESAEARQKALSQLKATL
jgi:hypothetical protein